MGHYYLLYPLLWHMSPVKMLHGLNMERKTLHGGGKELRVMCFHVDTLCIEATGGGWQGCWWGHLLGPGA
jgi:hypothetical protein